MSAISLAPGDVHLWYRFTESLDAAAIDRDVAQLSPDERERFARFVFPRDRRDFAAAHALLRQSLSDCADIAPDRWTFVTDAYGKPSIATGTRAPVVAFNLSHTPGLVACAIALDGEVGVDVESAERVTDSGELARRFFSAGEIAQLDACPDDQRGARFIEFWTLKEAYIKAIGTGLSHPLDSFGFDVDGPSGIQLTAQAGAAQPPWSFTLLTPSPRYRLAIAARPSRPAPCRFVSHAL